MILSIDLGETVVTRKITNDSSPVIFPDAVRVLRQLRNKAKEIYIISKVNEAQEKRSRGWLAQTDFLAITGIPDQNLFYCPEREDKAVIARKLGVTHHIDDRPEVMIHFDENVKKYLFKPRPDEVVDYFNQLKNTKIVKDWLDVEKELR